MGFPELLKTIFKLSRTVAGKTTTTKPFIIIQITQEFCDGVQSEMKCTLAS